MLEGKAEDRGIIISCQLTPGPFIELLFYDCLIMEVSEIFLAAQIEDSTQAALLDTTPTALDKAYTPCVVACDS